jgi:hypothetical protein
MKRKYWALAIIFSLLTLIGCTPYYFYLKSGDLTHENWLASVYRSPDVWMRGADHWFLTGDPNETEVAHRRLGPNGGISTTMVNVPGFTCIKAKGDFQLQIFGTRGHNSAYLYGPSEALKNVTVTMQGNTLVINQIKPLPCMGKRVIVRVGVNQLRSLTQLGTGTIEGIHLESDDLTITSLNKGSIYLSGNLNLRCVKSNGGGPITVIGANTPCLDIFSNGFGSCINICGNVGVRYIVHHGVGDINIIGANSAGLNVLVNGRGKIGIEGPVNVQDIRAYGASCVLITNVQSQRLSLYMTGGAYVGLAGRVSHLFLQAKDSSNFLGRNLCVLEAYVLAKDKAHVNLNARNRIFASARAESSIYLFGKTGMTSQFVKDNAAIISLAAAERSQCCSRS